MRTLILISLLSFSVNLFGQNEAQEFIYQKSAFVTPEIYPRFPGGEDSLLNFISRNIEYPRCQATVEGCVYVEFTIDTLGRVRKAKVMKSLEEHFDKKALRLIEKMPLWTPALIENRPISMEWVLPICFE